MGSASTVRVTQQLTESPFKYLLKLVYNNYPRGIILTAITTLKSIESQRCSAVQRGLNMRTDSFANPGVNRSPQGVCEALLNQGGKSSVIRAMSLQSYDFSVRCRHTAPREGMRLTYLLVPTSGDQDYTFS